jgi:DNA invertase Pin-like site-specific DNA recombinase
MTSVRVIPATVNLANGHVGARAAKRKVAAYARVSTGSEEQLTSYEAQVDYYTKYIKRKSEWEFVMVYTDEGITATNTNKRDGFKQMVADALDGKIDLIITKSVSRFARNTVDSLTTVRKLKANGVEVYFEKENIYTLDGKGELLITIMSSLAQEESRSISENVTWGQRKRMADGKVSLPYSHFLGYEKGAGGIPAVVESEAEVVRLIYRLFLEGGTPHGIGTRLMQMGIPTPSGKAKWYAGTIRSILSNEKYKGDALLQKKYTVDFLTKKTKVNEGEVPQYYVENSHPAIIPQGVFDMVQQEVKRRKTAEHRHSGVGIFAGRIICADCGNYFGSKVWHSSSKYRRMIYRCNAKFKGKDKCTTPHLTEDEIKTMFVSAVGKLLENKNEIIADLDEIKERLFDTSSLDTECAELESEIAVTAELIGKCIEENARTIVNQDEFSKRYAALAGRYETAKSRLGEIGEAKLDIKARRDMIGEYLAVLRKQDSLVTEFDERLWYSLAESVTVASKEDVRFTFRDGTVIQA